MSCDRKLPVLYSDWIAFPGMDQDTSKRSPQPEQTSRKSSHPALPLSVSIPDHELVRRIGHGSYGEVWLARNMMGMYRAVKFVFRDSFQHERPFERELSGIRKFEPISRSYEGFLDVLHVGMNEEQRYFYYVMELGDDLTSGQAIEPASYTPKTLAKELSLRGNLSLQECLQLGLALSQALAKLHKHGLVHRDIKPSNIIFVNGVLKLADIGLVADVSEARSYVGTEGFIPPEGPGAPQADVYSLGKVLYECCTGKDRQDFPELPTLLDQFPDHDEFLELNEVILHACRNDASERYRSAWDMHADLLVLANGKSVKRLKTLERRLSNLKRTASFLALSLVVVAAITYQAYREWRVRVEARQRQVGASIAYGNRAMETGNLLGALPYFADALRLDERSSRQEPTHRLRLGSILASCPTLTHMWFGRTQINDGEFGPDGRMALIAERFGAVKIYDLQTHKLLCPPFAKNSGLRTAACSPDGRFVVTANEDNTACVWNTTSLEKASTLPHPNKVLSARFSSDGLRIITACKDGVARVWNAATGQLEMSLEKHGNGILFANFCHDGKLIVTTSYDHTARLWNASDGRATGPPLAHGSWVTYAAFSPDNQRLVTASLDRKARVWEVATGTRIPPDLNHGDGVRSAEFSPDGRLIVTASLDGSARLWLADTLLPLGFNPVLNHGERLTRASFSADARRIVITCSDGSINIWDLAGSRVPPPPVPHSYSLDGSRFLTSTTNGIRVMDATSGQPVSSLMTTRRPLLRASLNRNGRFVVTVSLLQSPDDLKHQIQIWDVATGREIGMGLSVSNSINRFRLSDDGKRLVTFDAKSAVSWDVLTSTAYPFALSSDKSIDSAYLNPEGNRVAARSGDEVHVWDAETGLMSFPPLKHIATVGYVEFSPDGTKVVSCCWDDQFTKCYAQIWNAATGQPVGPRLQHGDGVYFASFSQDGNRVVTAGEDFRAVVWDARTGKQLTQSLRHEEKVRTATFSPDGKWVVTASSDRTARVWNADTGDPLTPAFLHLEALTSARFVADGRRVLTTDEQGSTRIWELPVDERPVEDLISLAHLLSRKPVAPAGEQSSPQTKLLEKTWQRLRSHYPSTFATSDEQIIAWHSFQAEDAETHHKWSAAVFHLHHLLTIQPDDLVLAQRLARAKENLRTQWKSAVGSW